MIGAVIVCLVTAQANVTVFASEDDRSFAEVQTSTSEDPGSASSIDDPATATDRLLTPLSPKVQTRLTLDGGLLAAKDSRPPLAIRQRRPYRMTRSGSIAAIMLGAVATIAGTAILVYANRPECTTNQFAGGCGYGTKVVGGSVVAGGVVGLFVGALTWR